MKWLFIKRTASACSSAAPPPCEACAEPRSWLATWARTELYVISRTPSWSMCGKEQKCLYEWKMLGPTNLLSAHCVVWLAEKSSAADASTCRSGSLSASLRTRTPFTRYSASCAFVSSRRGGVCGEVG
eukprot:scaffold261742_cov31-Tisochrysis_lutea.AAC.3